jgi:class 3 adenylate cyclase/predicted ATPase
MQCPQCQQANRDIARFCAACACPLGAICASCGNQNPSGAAFCDHCATPLTADTTAPTSTPPTPRGGWAEWRFHALLPEVMALLQRDGRVTYRRLKSVFSIDAPFLEEIREELTLRQLAIDAESKVLIWTGETQPTVHPSVIPTSPGTTPEAQTATPSVLPEPAGSVTDTEATQEEADTTLEPARMAPEAERRQLTVMFCDLADSTQLSQQLDPEDLREVIRAYQQTSAAVIHHFDGTIAQHLGDGLLIYFGWPAAHEDDAPRALHAGLDLVDAITSLNPRLEREHGVQLTVRIGIHTGPVVVGEMGGDGRHENLATGETVNVAARLEGLAAPNTVVISQVTARLVRGTFALETLGPQVLKGVAEPMPVFRVLGPLETHEDERVAAGVPFLVGRDEELGLLVRRWEQAKERLGQVVLVSGTAGIGKSRLVATLRAQVRQEGLPCIAFRCSAYHTNSALYPVITHVERLLGFERDDTPATKLDKLARGLRPYNQPLEEVVPLFAALLSVSLHDRYPAVTLTPQQQKQQTLDALVAWMLEEAERQPVLVVWEDLHWGDPSTLEMLGLVLEQTPTVPMLHVLTFRPEFAPPWPTRSHMTPITLNRLERPQVEALITHMAAGKALPAEVVEHIVAKTDGVPLYVEELTKMLLQSALLREETDQYVLTGPLLSVAIPDTLQDSLMARLDQMNTAKEIAQLGAVLGREFAYAMLQAIASQDEATVQAGLVQLVAAELLYQRGRPPRATYRFKHALIQDAAYASLLRSTRQQVHQQVAQLMEARFPELVETQPELVAHHYTAAGQDEAAIGYWQQAGQRAVERSAHQEAVSHLTQGLALLATRPDTPARHQHELAVQMALGPALMVLKGFGHPEVEQAYARARALCQQVGETPELFPVLYGLWRFYRSRGAFQAARELGEQLLTLAEQQDDPTLRLAAHSALGTTLYFLGAFAPTRRHLEQGIAQHTLQPHRAADVRYGEDPGGQCYGYLAWTLWSLGYPEQALHRSHEARTLAQVLAHPATQAMVLYGAARLRQLRREVPEAQELAEALSAVSAEHGNTYFLAYGTFLRGWALFQQRQHEEGLAQMQQGLAALRTAGAEVARPFVLTLLAEAYGTMAQADQGLSLLAEARTIMDQNGPHYLEAECHRLEGALRLRQTAPEVFQAARCFQQALDVACQQQAKSLELRAATSLARLWQSQGKRQEAYELLAPVYTWFTEGFDTADLQEARALLDDLGV